MRHLQLKDELNDFIDENEDDNTLEMEATEEVVCLTVSSSILYIYNKYNLWATQSISKLIIFKITKVTFPS